MGLAHYQQGEFMSLCVRASWDSGQSCLWLSHCSELAVWTAWGALPGMQNTCHISTQARKGSLWHGSVTQMNLGLLKSHGLYVVCPPPGRGYLQNFKNADEPGGDAYHQSTSEWGPQFVKDRHYTRGDRWPQSGFLSGASPRQLSVSKITTSKPSLAPLMCSSASLVGASAPSSPNVGWAVHPHTADAALSCDC